MVGTESVKTSLNILVRGAMPVPGMPVLHLRAQDWQSPDFHLASFDRQVEELAARAGNRPCAVCLTGADDAVMAVAALQVAIRCQRLRQRRNAASRCDTFDRSLAAHRQMYKPRQGGDAVAYARALDTWQWLLRLDPEATLAVQVAALFQGAARPAAFPEQPRTTAVAGRRDDAAGPEAAAQGAWMVDDLLAEHEIDVTTRIGVHRLLAGQGPDCDIARLAAAEALSCLSLAATPPAPVKSAASAGAAGATESASAAADEAHDGVAALLSRLAPPARQLVAALRLPGDLALQVAALRRRDDDAQSPLGDAAVASTGWRAAKTGGAAAAAACMSPACRTVAGRRQTTAATLARARMSAGLLGAAGFARTRAAALLARAAAVGALAVTPRVLPRAATTATGRVLAAVPLPARD
jgi:hypothetical protein